MASDSRNKGKREDDVFREHIGKVRPVKQDRIPPHRPKLKPVAAQSRKDAEAVIESLLSDNYEPLDVETGEELFYVRPGLQHSVIRKLRRGQYAIEAELDLHGCTVPQAREKLDAFLRRVRRMGKRCVRIIHGKGKTSEGKLPVLKGKVNVWLRQKDEIMAFCTAIPRDGGAGAVYALIKRD